MRKLDLLLIELQNNIAKQEIFNPEISASNVGWHIEHILLTIMRITGAMESSVPGNYKWCFKLPKVIVFTMNKIPRGRGKAPKVVVPNNYDEESLKKHMQECKLKVEQLYTLPSQHFFNHPYFGDLKLKQCIRFLEIHTKHHSKIVDDIIKSKSN